MARASLPYASVLGASDSRMRAEQMRAEREARVAALMGKGMETLAGAGSQALRAGADWQQQNAQLERQRRMDEAAAKQREIDNAQSAERLGFDRMRAEREQKKHEAEQARQQMLDQQDLVLKSVPALARGPGTPEEKRQALVVWGKNNDIPPQLMTMARAKLETEIEAVQDFGAGLKGKEAQARLAGANADVAEGTREARIAEAGLNVQGKELDIEGKEQDIDVRAAKEEDRALDAALERAMGVAQRGGTMDEVMSVMPEGTDPAAVQAFIRDAGRTRGMEDDAFLRAKEKAKSDLRTAAVSRNLTRARTDLTRAQIDALNRKQQEDAVNDRRLEQLPPAQKVKMIEQAAGYATTMGSMSNALKYAEETGNYGIIKNNINGFLNRLGVSGEDFRAMNMQQKEVLSERLHEMSGAAINKEEAVRLMATLPDPNSSTFPKDIQNWMQEYEGAMSRRVGFYEAAGFDVTPLRMALETHSYKKMTTREPRERGGVETVRTQPAGAGLSGDDNARGAAAWGGQ